LICVILPLNQLFQSFLTQITSVIFNLKTSLTFNFFYDFFLINLQINNGQKLKDLNVASSSFNNTDSKNEFAFNHEELSSNFRYRRFDNPVFKYDYKSGDYYPKLYKEVYPYLFTSAIDLTGGLRQAP
jgi:hypothetical protein